MPKTRLSLWKGVFSSIADKPGTKSNQQETDFQKRLCLQGFGERFFVIGQV